MTDYGVPHLSSLLPDDELARIRTQFPVMQHVAYLNAGTLGPLPTVAIEAMAAEARYDAEVRQSAGLLDRIRAAQAGARGAICSLTGVAAEQVALMHSTHEGINTALWGMPLAAGHSIITTDEEHPGLLVPLHHLVQRIGIDVRIAPWQDDDAAFVAGVLELVDADTRAVALSHVSWVSGRVAPLNELRRALPDGVRLIVDGAQAAGMLPIDPTDGWDAYTVSGQKWPCGPNGTGGLALVDPEAWRPTFGAYLQSTSPREGLTAPLVSDGRRFETSQEAMTPLVGLAASVAWLVTEVGTWRATAHARALNERLRSQLTSVDVTISGDAHLACVELGAPRAVAVVEQLATAGMSIRAVSASRLRVSLGCWNTVDEIDGCAAGIAGALSSPD